MRRNANMIEKIHLARNEGHWRHRSGRLYDVHLQTLVAKEPCLRCKVRYGMSDDSSRIADANFFLLGFSLSTRDTDKRQKDNKDVTDSRFHSSVSSFLRGSSFLGFKLQMILLRSHWLVDIQNLGTSHGKRGHPNLKELFSPGCRNNRP